MTFYISSKWNISPIIVVVFFSVKTVEFPKLLYTKSRGKSFLNEIVHLIMKLLISGKNKVFLSVYDKSPNSR